MAPDCHVKSGKALYSVPWRLIGQKIIVRTAGDVVQIFHNDVAVATHVLHLTGRSTNFEHYPPHKIAHTLRSVTWCRTQAEQIGPGAVAIVAELSTVNAIHRLRAIQGIIRLRETYGDTRLDAACARALAIGDPGYRTVKGILVAGTEHGDDPPHSPRRRRRRCCAARRHSTPNAPPDPQRPSHPLIRFCCNHIEQRNFVMTIHDPSLRAALKTLKLTGMLDTLDARLAQTRDGKLGHLEFLQVLCEDEIARRETAALARRVRRARFEQPNTFEDFDFTVSPKLPAAMLRDLAALRWLEAGESVILYGPVGVGKTHVAQALGHQVARRGGDIRFVKCSRMLADLAGGHADRTIGQRMREYTRPLVLIVDDFAMREHTPTQSDDLYDLVSDRAIAAKPLILTSNREPKKRTCSREPVRKWRRNVTRSHLSGFGEPVGQSAIVEVIGEVDHRSLGSHPERCRYDFRVDRIDQVGQSGSAQRLGVRPHGSSR